MNINQEILGKFDYIECNGVLHHLKDPLVGWSKLIDVLNENGIMKIGLYSQLARRDLNKFKSEYKKETDGYDIEKLYKTRFEILKDRNSKYSKFLKWKDFYSASAFRDMAAHVQEQQYTIPMIKESLDQLGLEFVCFQVSSDLASKFLTEFPEKRCLFDLDCWHEFENKHPDSFIELYKFWCQKK